MPQHSGQQLPKLSLAQKAMAILTLIGFGIVAFFMAGIVLTLFLALVVVGLIAAGVRWIWCKVTGKPFIPGLQLQYRQTGRYSQSQSTQQQQKQKKSSGNASSSNTIEGEYKNVD